LGVVAALVPAKNIRSYKLPHHENKNYETFVVYMTLRGYANEHVKQKEKWYNNFFDNKYVNK
jgi:hypothetical protein